MTHEYSGIANYLTGIYDIPPEKIWRSLTPGYHTYYWINMDKSHLTTPFKVIGYLAVPVTDAIKLAFYSGATYGLARTIIEVRNSPFVENTIDKLF